MKKLLLFFFILLLVIFALLQLSVVQTYLAQRVSVSLSQRTGYGIELDKIDIKWFDVATIDGLLILDRDKDTLIYAKSATVDYTINTLIGSDTIILDDLVLNSPLVNLKWYPTGTLNITDFIRSFKKKKQNKKKIIVPVIIRHGSIIGGQFSYKDPRKEPMNDLKRFDYNFFDLDSINGDVSQFMIRQDTISLVSNQLEARESNINFKVKDIQTKFQYCRKSMEFVDSDVRTSKSRISNFVRFEYNSNADFSHFVDSIKIKADLDSTFIHTKELAYFAPAIGQFNDVWGISGHYTGKVSNFRSKNARLSFGKKSHINSSRIAISGLPDIREANIRADVKRSKINYEDVQQYLPSQKIRKEFKYKVGKVVFDGFFHGFSTDFVSEGNFDTDLGHFETDIKFKYNDQLKEKASYEGELRTTNYNLGRFLNTPSIGEVNMKGKIVGEGLTAEDANLHIDGLINQLEYENYVYKDIDLHGELQKNHFNGDLLILDTNARLNLHGELDLETEKFDVQGDIIRLALKPLGFSEREVVMSSTIDWNFTGLDIDEVEGRVFFKDAKITTSTDSLFLKKVLLASRYDNGKRDFKITSSLVDFDARGDFKFREIIKDVRQDIAEYKDALLNRAISGKITPSEKYNIIFDTEIHDLQPLLNIFSPYIQVSKNTRLRGSYSLDSNTIFELSGADIKHLKYKDYEFFNTDIDIHSSKIPMTNHVLGQYFISSDLQKYQNKSRTENLDIEIYWADDSLTFDTKIKQFGNTNRLALQGDLLFNKDTVTARLINSKANILKKNWKLNNDNKVEFTKGKVYVDNLSFSSGKESIMIDGEVSSKENARLLVNTQNFQLDNISQFLKVKFNGSLTGVTEVLSQNEYYKTTSTAQIRNFKMLNTTLGDFNGKFIYDDYTRILTTNADFFHKGKKVARLKGHYDTKDNNSPINVDILIKDTPLNLLEPFLYGHATEMKGLGNGKVHVSGTLKDPNFKGDVAIKGGFVTISYLNTRYAFDDKVYFDKDKIFVKDLLLKDVLWQTTALLNGGLSHKMFKKFIIDTKITLDNTFIMNTKADDNELYYGQAFGTGDIYLSGPFSEFKIYSEELTSNANTKIYIPLDGTETVSQKSFITFVDPHKKEKLQVKDTTQAILKGVLVDVNLNITPDAYMEIIFDKKAGDIIKGVGDGQIHLDINTRGDFFMTGQYSIHRGTYNFTLINLFDKRFNIQDNSTITWRGDPYKGELDIKAKYTQYASLKPIADTLLYDLTRSEFSRQYPVDVGLNLTGELLHPDVKFDLDIKQTPTSIEDLVVGFEGRIKNNEQERNKQAFSLIVLKQFAPEESFIGGFGAGSSVSELLSNQFSNWISQFDENLNIQIDMQGSDFRVQFEYSVLDGRLRITQNNNFTNTNSTNSLANVFGEWTLEYIITNDGKLKLKAYNKTQNNSLNSATGVNNATNTLYGVSLSYSTSFNRFSELLSRNLKKKLSANDPIQLDLNQDAIKEEE